MRVEYADRKVKARQQAEKIKHYTDTHKVRKSDRERIKDYLEKLAKNAGLLTEFKRNGYL